MQIELKDLDNLRHMLGIGDHIKKGNWGHRNYFHAAGDTIPSMKRLEAAGLVKRGAITGYGAYFYATKTGCHAVGLSAAGIKRALDG